MLPLRCPRCFSKNITDYILGISVCKHCKKTFKLTDELYDILHQLWGKAKKNPLYLRSDKLLWARLREILHELANVIYKK